MSYKQHVLYEGRVHRHSPPLSFFIWPADIRDEAVGAGLLLLLAVADLRWLVSNIISTTDATPTSAATTVAVVDESLARALYQSTEVVGFPGGPC